VQLHLHRQRLSIAPIAPLGFTNGASDAPPAPDVGLTDIFAATETGVQILRAVPGSTKAERAVNLAKLYLYGLQALTERDTARFAEIGPRLEGAWLLRLAQHGGVHKRESRVSGPEDMESPA
jgi:hypothetical protein